MNPVLNSPMASYSRSEGLDLLLKTHNIVSCLFGYFLSNRALRLNHPDTTQSLPCPFWVQTCNNLFIINHPMLSNLDTTVPFLRRFIKMGLYSSQFTDQRLGKGLLNSSAQSPMIIFECEDKVSIVVHNLFGDILLCP